MNRRIRKKKKKKAIKILNTYLKAYSNHNYYGYYMIRDVFKCLCGMNGKDVDDVLSVLKNSAISIVDYHPFTDAEYAEGVYKIPSVIYDFQLIFSNTTFPRFKHKINLGKKDNDSIYVDGIKFPRFVKTFSSYEYAPLIETEYYTYDMQRELHVDGLLYSAIKYWIAEYSN